MTRLSLSIVLLGLAAVGCSSTANHVSNDYISVGGEKLKRDSDGVVIVSKEQLQLLKGQKDIVVLDSVLPAGGVAVTESELQLLSKDKQLLEETIEGTRAKSKVYTFLIKKGSLKENLMRLSEKFTTESEPLSLEYGDVDYYVEQSSIVRSNSIDELVAETLNSFPVFASIEGVTFYLKQGSLKTNLQRLSNKYSTDVEPLSVDYNGGDLYVPQGKLLRADSLEELIASILAPYPVFSAIE